MIPAWKAEHNKCGSQALMQGTYEASTTFLNRGHKRNIIQSEFFIENHKTVWSSSIQSALFPPSPGTLRSWLSKHKLFSSAFLAALFPLCCTPGWI